MKKILLFLVCVLGLQVHAQQFNDYFDDATLRIDYTFSGDVHQQRITLDKLNRSPRWYGKRQRLAEVPVEGNGQIIVRHHATRQEIYRQSFSTLFQEWLSYDEPQHTARSFENVFLVPMPKDTVDITLELYNNRRAVMATFTHQVVPTDILIRHIGEHHRTPFVQLLSPKDTSRCIHIAFIAEGYQPSEMPTFIADATSSMEAIFAHEPFKSLKDRFSVVAVQAPSIDSGTSIPSKGIWKQTALSSHFDTFYSERYLTTLNLKDLHDQLAGIPYEHIIVLVNTAHYGGGGILNSYNLSMAHHPLTRPVVVHEFGHSFAGLADEYGYANEQIPMYPHDVEPWEPNLTTLVHFGDKWKDMLPARTPIPTPQVAKNQQRIGVYEGGGYALHGVYRPMMDCRMRTNENPEFCPVCQRAIRRLIQFYTE